VSLAGIRFFGLSAAALAVILFGFGGIATQATAKKNTATKAKKKPKKPAKKKPKKPAKKKPAPEVAAKADFVARGSVGELYVTGADPDQQLLLVNSNDRIVRESKADDFGSKIFYYLKEGTRYRVLSRKDDTVVGTPLVTVRKQGAHPKKDFYRKQKLNPGLIDPANPKPQYITMRDGVKIAVTVRLPKDGLVDRPASQGPFPTFIELSGYQVAAPKDFISSLFGGEPGDPLVPASSTSVGSVIGPLTDFATVSVQMRGSGCSGGAFDLFGLPTTYDAYDVIETIAAQSWVKGNKVGMGGISFSGISQLFAAGTRPPSLAAISPLSVTDDIYTATGFPGGIFNNGFAYSWIRERASDAVPAPGGGHPYARALTDPASPNFDAQCAQNQKLRLQTQDYEKLIENNRFRTSSLFSERSPGKWLSRVKAPTFLVGSFQDEQTGAHFVNSLNRIPARNKDVWITLMNGVHSDPLGPDTITRWVDFMNLFVANRIPKVPDLVIGLSGTLYDQLTGAPAVPVKQSRFANFTSVAKARAAFRKDPRVRILMDNGNAIEGDPGALGSKWEFRASNWPIRNVKPSVWFMGENGTLSTTKPGSNRPSSQRSVSYVGDPDARPAQTISRGDEWAAQPEYDWAPLAEGKGLGFITPALTRDAVIAGNSSVDLWLRSSAEDTDLQVTITEVRPDGKETLVQNGWLRASHRKLAKSSTALRPVPTHLSKDARPLDLDAYNRVRVPVFPVAHAFRAGSKIRLNIQAPGGDRQIWRFDTIENGETRNTIGIGGQYPSRLVLPVVTGATAKGTPLPPPTALRGQPSRDYVPASNGG